MTVSSVPRYARFDILTRVLCLRISVNTFEGEVIQRFELHTLFKFFYLTDYLCKSSTVTGICKSFTRKPPKP